MNKKTLAEIAGLNANKIDFTIPQSLFDEMRNNRIDPSLFVYSYENTNVGELKNLAEEFVYNSQDKIQIDTDKFFKYIEELKKELNKIQTKEPFYITLMELIQCLHENKILEIKEDKNKSMNTEE